MVKLSVIICVYNTDSDMLEQCLKSVRGGLMDTEIIVVDDGSAVSYAQLVQSFGAKYVRTENCGTLHARLLGVSLAQGQYVAFVDADDEVSFCYHSGLCAVAERENADIVLGDWAFLTPKTAYVCQNDSTIKETFVTSDCLQRYFQHAGKEHSWYVLWNKVFRRTLLQQACQQVQMHPIGRQVFAEDVLITFFAFLYASRVANVHLGYYFYRLHASQQTNVNSFERFSAHVSQSAFVFDVMRSELEKLFRTVAVFIGKRGGFSRRKAICATGFWPERGQKSDVFRRQSLPQAHVASAKHCRNRRRFATTLPQKAGSGNICAGRLFPKNRFGSFRHIASAFSSLRQTFGKGGVAS